MADEQPASQELRPRGQGAEANLAFFVTEYWKAVVIAVVVGAVVFGVWEIWKGRQNRRSSEASAELFQARDAMAPDSAGGGLLLVSTDPTPEQLNTAVDRYVTVAQDYAGLPQAEEALLEMGNALFQLEEHDRARQAYQTVLATSDDALRRSLAMNGLGYVEEAAGNHAQAAAQFDQLRALVSGELAELAWLDMGRNLEAAGDAAAAEALYQEFTTTFAGSTRLTEVESRLTALASNE